MGLTPWIFTWNKHVRDTGTRNSAWACAVTRGLSLHWEEGRDFSHPKLASGVLSGGYFFKMQWASPLSALHSCTSKEVEAFGLLGWSFWGAYLHNIATSVIKTSSKMNGPLLNLWLRMESIKFISCWMIVDVWKKEVTKNLLHIFKLIKRLY